MQHDPRPTGKGLNRPQRLIGIDMRFLGMAIILPVLINGVTDNWKLSVGIFALLCCVGRWLSRKDPNIVRIAMTAWRQKSLYDPMKRTHFRTKVESKVRG